jgi:hypothetical protein
MPPNEIFTIAVALTSLIISILSFLYARKAYQLDVAKFQIEQSSHDVFLDFTETLKYEYRDYTILETKLQIRNKSSVIKLAVYFNVNLCFGYYWKTPHFSSPKVELSIAIHDKSQLISSRNELFTFLERQEPTRFVVIDAETKREVTFSPDNTKRIEAEPISYSWVVYTIIPQSVIEYLESQEINLDLLKLDMMLHPKEWKSRSSHRFPMSFGAPPDYVLSLVFPDGLPPINLR